MGNQISGNDDHSPSSVHADKPRPWGAALRSWLARCSFFWRLQRDRRQQILHLNALTTLTLCAAHISTLRGAPEMSWRKLASPATASSTTSYANPPEPPTAASQCQYVRWPIQGGCGSWMGHINRNLR